MNTSGLAPRKVNATETTMKTWTGFWFATLLVVLVFGRGMARDRAALACVGTWYAGIVLAKTVNR